VVGAFVAIPRFELVSLSPLQLERDAVVLAAFKLGKTKKDWENKAAGRSDHKAFS
jgi:hypothetical protein